MDVYRIVCLGNDMLGFRVQCRCLKDSAMHGHVFDLNCETALQNVFTKVTDRPLG